MSRRSRTTIALYVTLAALLAACSVAGPSPEVPSAGSAVPATTQVASEPSPTPDPCPQIPDVPPSAPPNLEALDEATQTATNGRLEYGLRFDLEWVRQVAADPRADTAFGFPLLPEEEMKLFARGDLGPPVVTALSAYRHEDELGGLYIDNRLGGVVTVLWTANLDEHAVALRGLLPPCHPVIFRPARWSEVELRKWQDRIAADWDWFEQIPAAPRGVGADVIANVVSLEISSANPAAADIIVAHYDAPAGMIRVESDGTGAALLGWGTVQGRVRTVDGRPPGPNELTVDQGPNSAPGACGFLDVGFGVGEDGTFEFPCQIGRRTIQIRGRGEIFGEATVNVPLDGVVVAEIRLTKPIEP